MKTITFDKDIAVMYVQATSFPNGVMAAHEKLHSIVPHLAERKYLGISRPEKGAIQYKAGAEVIKEGEANQYGLSTLVLPKGDYVSITINDYMKDIPAIGKAFNQLIALPAIDPNGYCVEWYLNNKDVICMVRMVE